ncbi:FAD binding domain-containing protein [Stappia indica]|uniref:FAD binding domain-containing protein n=1 Tax=Stappia indica TaxID=538381 RepID=UPI001CD318C3|nr:xanthine dehydrogenase family protein subunit M [Stappia indica]MCA1299491.1 xanthine dehydrogenase family protein subunit M [Stappia indica]
MNGFAYLRPGDLAEALAFLREGDEASPLAGGQTLVPTMKQGLAAPETLIDLGGLAELAGLRVTPTHVEVGAMCPHAAVAAAPGVRAACPALAELAGMIGDAQVRNRGTIGGSIANNDPAADYPAACLGLNAVIRTDRRDIAADDFFLGMFETALEPGELIVSVAFPRCREAAYLKFRNPASRFALAGVFLARHADGVRIAVTGAGTDGVFRWSEAEAALGREFTASALAGLAVPVEDMLGDLHAAADYRAHLVKVLTARALAVISERS